MPSVGSMSLRKGLVPAVYAALLRFGAKTQTNILI